MNALHLSDTKISLVYWCFYAYILYALLANIVPRTPSLWMSFPLILRKTKKTFMASTPFQLSLSWATLLTPSHHRHRYLMHLAVLLVSLHHYAPPDLLAPQSVSPMRKVWRLWKGTRCHCHRTSTNSSYLRTLLGVITELSILSCGLSFTKRSILRAACRF